MSIDKVLLIGLAGNEVSKKITNTDEVSVGRTAIASGAGATIGAVAAGTVIFGTGLVGTATAPITVPLAVGGAIIGGIASLFD